MKAPEAPALPAPYATPSARNPPRIVPRPRGALPQAPEGFEVTRFAGGFEGARWMAEAPNGDIFVTDHVASSVWVLTDADHDGRADGPRRRFVANLAQPFGIAFHPDGWLYVACTDGVMRWRYRPGQRVAEGRADEVVALPGEGYNQHWTRNLIVSPDGRALYVTVGSETNNEPEADPRRAAISTMAPDGGGFRVFAGGLRNPVGMAFRPDTETLYAVVNERDGLGDGLVPDYFTSVRDQGFYGWPYAYFGPNEDPDRRGERPDLVARAVVPDLALGAHVAALGLVFPTRGALGVARGDALVSLHGSWNRAQRVGYKVVRVHFEGDRPVSLDDRLTGFVLADDTVWGRPVGLVERSDGALLVADDAGGVIWQVTRRRGPAPVR